MIHDDARDWGPSDLPRGMDPHVRPRAHDQQIATLCRVDYEKVRLHIRSQERRDPTLLGRRLILHDRQHRHHHNPGRLTESPGRINSRNC